ncbi:MAG: hypothetical protein JO108_12610 [Acidobacteriaceae bacterium]|nr:hypothetical protein [Acidobacteriaceae bacterium]
MDRSLPPQNTTLGVSVAGYEAMVYYLLQGWIAAHAPDLLVFSLDTRTFGRRQHRVTHL